jgi:hypothetical protein
MRPGIKLGTQRAQFARGLVEPLPPGTIGSVGSGPGQCSLATATAAAMSDGARSSSR